MNRTRPRSSGSSRDGSLRYRQLWWRNE